MYGPNITMLSVDQLWEEQQFDTRFANARCLAVPGGRTLPFEPKRPGAKLPTLMLISTASLSSRPKAAATALAANESLPSPPPPPQQPPAEPSEPQPSASRGAGRSTTALGFHRVGSSSFVARLPAARKPQRCAPPR